MSKIDPADIPEDEILEENSDLDENGKKKKSTCAKIMTFLFSEVGLLIIVVAYIVLGGLMFEAIELPDEKNSTAEVRIKAGAIEEERRRIYHEVLTITNYALDNDHNRTWTVIAYKEVLDRYQLMLIDAIADGYDGTVHKEEDEQYGWSSTSAILFAATILTTIGYGHVSPSSEVGRLVCILYSVMAVPLMSIFLIKVGGAVTKFIRLSYNRGCCFCCGKKRMKQRTRDLNENGDTIAEVHREQVVERDDVLKELGVDPTQVVEQVPKQCSDDFDATPPTMLVLFIVISYLFIGTVVFHLTEGWSLINAIYCCFVTLTTLGFGDYVPGVSGGNSFGGQMLLTFTAFYVMVGLAVLAMGIDIVGETFSKVAGVEEEEEEEEGKEEEPGELEPIEEEPEDFD